MHKFDYSFLKSLVPNDVLRLTNLVSELNVREEYSKLGNELVFDKLKHMAIIESVRGSNAIEGVVTTKQRLIDIINGEAPVTHNEKEISGYKDVLNEIHNSYNVMDLNKETLLKMHDKMLSYSNPDFRGVFKQRDNLIMEYKDGIRSVRFKPVPAKDTEFAVDQWLLAFYDARQDSTISPLLLIPCVILDFLCIHPFTDGNGRISRLLTVFLMYMFGYDIGRYISIEGMIDNYKESYYEALGESSKGWEDNSNDYMPFAINFLQITYKCYKELDKRFVGITLKKAKKSMRIRNVVLNSISPISKKEIMEYLPDVSISTIELELGRMLKENKIEMLGFNKDARYIKKQ